MKKKLTDQEKKVKLPKGFTIQHGLDKQYEDQPLFQEKVDRANHILKKFGLPKNQPHHG